MADARKTYAELVATTTVADEDLLATFPGAGPLKQITASEVRTYMAATSADLTLENVTAPNTALLNLEVVYAEAFIEDGDDGDFALAVQRAHDALTDAGTIRVRAGVKQWKSAVTFTKPVLFRGEGWCESPTPTEGTWVSIEDDSFDPLTITGTAAAGFQLRDMAFWQLHPTVIDAPWVPTDYPYVINMVDTAGGCYIDNVLFTNINKWVYSFGSGRTSWGRIWGMPLRVGFYIDAAYDAPHGEDLHVWPFGYAASPYYGARVQAWTIANADLFIFGRVDTPMISTVFALGCRSILRPIKTAAGVPSKVNITTLIADNCKYIIYDPDGDVDGMDFIFGAATHQALTLAGGTTPVAGAMAFSLTSDFVNIQVGTLFSEWYARYGVSIAGTGCGLQIGNLKMDRVNEDNGSYGIFKLASGNNVQVNQVEINSLYTTPLNDSTSASQVKLSRSNPVGAGELIPAGLLDTLTPYAQTGTITTSTATLRYEFDGAWADCNLDIAITTAGTGTGFLFVDLPFNSFLPFFCVGEDRVTGLPASLRMDTGDNTARVINLLDGTSMIRSGSSLNFSFRLQRKALS